ncbi:MAG: glycosyltransferase family 2 protein [Desulfobulbaceae bacterium]|nr:glycosyltransferase family 2 protein [Desulfobulbaceae bacterium]HIJ79552.1 glycosyltransferase family 2 protein [Deltaproteobacteria bacterium]
MAQPDISIIIVNYNTADLLAKCLSSIFKQDVATEIFVVDNNSQDNSIEMVQKNFGTVKLITNKINAGFAKANNQAVRLATGRYIYFLNPDTEIHGNALEVMLCFMNDYPQVGMAGTQLIFPDNSPQSSLEYRYPGQRYAKKDLAGLPGDIAWLLGASIIARREVIEQVGGFDEDYFLYGEDLDLSLKIRKKGWSLGYIPEAEIVHWEGQSERNSLPIQVWEKKFRAELLFYRKHYSARTIAKIRRANILQALWRILTIRTMLPFQKDTTRAKEKLAKYHLALKFFSGPLA